MSDGELLFWAIGFISGMAIGMFGVWNIGIRDFKRVRK